MGARSGYPSRQDSVADHNGRMRQWLDPRALIGLRLTSVTVGWHVHGSSRKPVLLFLGTDDAGVLEVCTAGDASLRLDQATEPQDFDMAQYGRFEFQPVEQTHVLRPHIGSTIHGVERIRWRETTVGLLVHFANGAVVLANEADEIFVSTGSLPPDYRYASIEA